MNLKHLSMLGFNYDFSLNSNKENNLIALAAIKI